MIELEQKIRTKAREITDIAISKVPCTKLSGFSNEQNKVIQEQHRKLLSLVKQLNAKTEKQVKEAYSRINSKERLYVKKTISELEKMNEVQKMMKYKDIERIQSISEDAKYVIANYEKNVMEMAILIDLHFLGELTPENLGVYYWILEGKSTRKVKADEDAGAKEAMDTFSTNRLLLMHNHPSTGTFSGQDLKTFWNNPSIYIITAIGNDGSVYILQKDYNFDAEKLAMGYGHYAKKYWNRTNNGTLAIREILKNASDYGLIYKEGRHRA